MHYHIVGIGGAGMNAIAHILLDRGDTVSGSDAQRSAAWLRSWRAAWSSSWATTHASLRAQTPL